MRHRVLAWSFAPPLLSLALAGCSGSEPVTPVDTPPGTPDIDYPAFGSTSAESGKGSFRFGAASAATQIEDQNPTTDWYAWTAAEPEGLGKDTFIGDAAMGYTMALEDVDLVAEMGLDSYRFSVEWARVEPVRDMIDEAALAHYDALIDALLAKGIRPMITIHHFSNPIWVDDPRATECTGGPGDANLCGLNHPVGGPMVVEEIAAHARLLAERFGDRVDDWCTVNEPVNYLVASYGAATFPPGKFGILDAENEFIPAVRTYIDAHAAMYRAIKEADTVDADDDGLAASVGFTHGAQDWVPARDGALSVEPDDVAARDRLVWVYHYLFVEALRQGKFDADLDGTLDEDHPEWQGTLDWLGVQYYFRAGVTASPAIVPLLDLTACFGTFDSGSCVPPLDPTFRVPAMNYEHNPAGLYTVLHDFSARWPDLPLTVTESGIATLVGARRAEMTVRALEQIDKARAEGADVRGYYHWSLYDNFEWNLGFEPRFGLYQVDYTTFTRTATEGATALGDIAKARKLPEATRKKYGGSGPMTEEK
jgi:beta-glucosidase/6-phospho-beta-glucosidase/beta-galactosidase